MLKKIIGSVRRFWTDRRGDTNTIGWIVLIIFIILAVAPYIQDIGETMIDGTSQLNDNLNSTLGN